jgi:GGDEF domain-containing protein
VPDRLTGVASRVEFDAAVRQRATPFGLVYLDVVDMRTVNLALGHERGDAVLVALARRLAAVVGGRGLVGRVGGDEFAVLLPDTGTEVAWLVAAELEQAVAEGVLVALDPPLRPAPEELAALSGSFVLVGPSDATLFVPARGSGVEPWATPGPDRPVTITGAGVRITTAAASTEEGAAPEGLWRRADEALTVLRKARRRGFAFESGDPVSVRLGRHLERLYDAVFDPERRDARPLPVRYFVGTVRNDGHRPVEIDENELLGPEDSARFDAFLAGGPAWVYLGLLVSADRNDVVGVLRRGIDRGIPPSELRFEVEVIWRPLVVRRNLQR